VIKADYSNNIIFRNGEQSESSPLLFQSDHPGLILLAIL